VAKFNGRYKVLDGHHRVGGAIERGDRTIRVRQVK
jgi:ParB-like chromosome segregation protein Spo0J